jgi:hypothetical protein
MMFTRSISCCSVITAIRRRSVIDYLGRTMHHGDIVQRSVEVLGPRRTAGDPIEVRALRTERVQQRALAVSEHGHVHRNVVARDILDGPTFRSFDPCR